MSTMTGSSQLRTWWQPAGQHQPPTTRQQQVRTGCGLLCFMYVYVYVYVGLVLDGWMCVCTYVPFQRLWAACF